MQDSLVMFFFLFERISKTRQEIANGSADSLELHAGRSTSWKYQVLFSLNWNKKLACLKMRKFSLAIWLSYYNITNRTVDFSQIRLPLSFSWRFQLTKFSLAVTFFSQIVKAWQILHPRNVKVINTLKSLAKFILDFNHLYIYLVPLKIVDSSILAPEFWNPICLLERNIPLRFPIFFFHRWMGFIKGWNASMNLCTFCTKLGPQISRLQDEFKSSFC